MLPVKVTERTKEISAKDAKSLIPLMVLMVIIFLIFLYWENELNQDVGIMTLEHLYVDHPKSDIPVRYCNSMILRRVIREPDHSCKKEHVFIHERPQIINGVCNSPKKMICGNDSLTLCFQSEQRFKMTVCQLSGGTRYPACRYHSLLTEAFITVSCNVLGPAKFYEYVK
ncbi:probable inactive ribonuclease-like protein 12 [Sorex araneus]|uniref:probable inactive ribonuclease-like protein 12 n=1 Tax=Sorex araneus TaxID=42254 RepID=UPI0024334B2C|nr:probable inactive ribonuclease-like protein 12 [Sorex araneus]